MEFLNFRNWVNDDVILFGNQKKLKLERVLSVNLCGRRAANAGKLRMEHDSLAPTLTTVNNGRINRISF